MSFHLRDIYLPGPAEFKESMNPDTKILGCVVDFSDSGSDAGAFAVVQTDQRSRVIVPVANLSLVQRR